MRKSLINQAREFIEINSSKNNFIFDSSEIKLTIKNFLVKNNYLYSPIKNIFILKKSDDDISKKIEKYKYWILEKLGGVLSWEFLINYYLLRVDSARVFRIITKSKNFESFLWEENNLRIIFKPSKIPRLTRKVKIENYTFEIETKLSFMVNNYYLFWENKDFQKIILETNFSIENIEELINKKFKFSSISKIAIFYKNSWKTGKYETIIKAMKNCWKKIDRRWTKVIKKVEKKKKSEKIDLNDLF